VGEDFVECGAGGAGHVPVDGCFAVGEVGYVPAVVEGEGFDSAVEDFDEEFVGVGGG